MRVLYLDCFSGISGDMMVGALVDLGVKPSALEWELSKLEIGDFHMHFDRGQRQHIAGIKFGIHAGATHTHSQDAEESPEDCAQDHSHAHGHKHSHGGEAEPEHPHAAEHSHEHEHEHEHDAHHDDDEDDARHAHDHDHGAEVNVHAQHTQEHGSEHEHSHAHGHSHEHGSEHAHTHAQPGAHSHGHHAHAAGRTHREIRALIEKSELSAFVKKHALGIFGRIAVAEGKIHGMPAEDVGFHEVGALDSIADIVCACAGIEALGVEKVFVSRLADGHGTLECAHGTFPVPAPATLEILRGIPLGQIDEPHELITPTGAAIAAEFGASFGVMPEIKSERIGYGLGSRELASRPNVLRAVLGELSGA